VKYHSATDYALTAGKTNCGTVAGGEFDWGGRLPKGNGGAQWFPQAGWQPAVERKGRRELDSEANKPSWGESRA
jgi:hypothetical protein